jgi:hypothetical protein
VVTRLDRDRRLAAARVRRHVAGFAADAAVALLQLPPGAAISSAVGIAPSRHTPARCVHTRMDTDRPLKWAAKVRPILRCGGVYLLDVYPTIKGESRCRCWRTSPP